MVARARSSAEDLSASRALLAGASPRGGPIVLALNRSAAAGGAAPAIYCVHSISGAGGSDFLPLARRLGEAVRVFGLQAPPGRMAQASFGASVPSLAALYAGAILETQPAAELVVAGWSAGASIALEIAQQLRALDREVSLLVAFEGAPEIPRAGLRPWDPRYLLAVAVQLPAWLRDMRATGLRVQVRAVLRRLRALAARFGGRALVREPEAAVGLAGYVDLADYPPAQRRFMTRLYHAIMAYEPAPWDGPVVVYEASITPALRLPQYLARWRWVAPQAQGVTLEGNHVTIMREPRVADLANDLRARILGAAPAAQAPGRAAAAAS